MTMLGRTIIAGLLLAGLACSSSEDKEAETDLDKKFPEQAAVAITKSVVDSIKVWNYDSLAAIRYPIRKESNKLVTMVTDSGSMTIELYRDLAPIHVDSFLARTADGFYKGLVFHRVMEDFMIQTGDPMGTGQGNAGYFLPAEFSDVKHDEGTLSMARRGGRPNSASSQFFVVLQRNRGTLRLDGQYTVFGHLIAGFDALHRIGSTELIPNAQGKLSKPKDDIVIRDLYLSDAEGNIL